MPLQPSNPWLFPVKQVRNSSLRLFCFPYAGASGQVFAAWAPLLPENVEVWALQLPGRASRVRERSLRSIRDLAAATVDAIDPLLDRAFVFFGHSMGSLVAFQAARHLRAHAKPAPVALILSGASSPELPPVGEQLHKLPKESFKARLRDFEGTPPQILDCEELLEIVLPALRADFEASETYSPDEEAPLNVPLIVFGGENDPDVPLDHLEAWRPYASRDVIVQQFPGGHFYLQGSSMFFTALNATLRRVLSQLHSSVGREGFEG